MATVDALELMAFRFSMGQVGLQRRLLPEEISALHLRASEWFELGGLITESIGHVLRSEDVESAADVIERHRHQKRSGGPSGPLEEKAPL